jgi:hypothetical protein
VPSEKRKSEVQREVAAILDSLQELMREPDFSRSAVQLLRGEIANRERGDADHGTR